MENSDIVIKLILVFETAKDEGIIKRAKMAFISIEVPTKLYALKLRNRNHTQRILVQNLLGTQFSMFYNPKFLSQCTVVHDLRNPTHIAIGIVEGGNVNMLQELYEKWVQADRINVLHDYKVVVLGKIAVNSILAIKYNILKTISELSKLVHTNFENDIGTV
ncbi:hypothetical protein DVH24_016132 [Malus domestica]|uniref:Uncharacterized protein n=1 Tax=Malus domestica TaxID=3750 RepID=A0A498JGQ5_MALDO|nr:hypothetical protein DVH24_016132 [Malus domestica]